MYSQGTAQMRHKGQANVVMRLTGGDPFEATVFVALGERLTDLLNDGRRFIPARVVEDGKTIIVAKSQIISIIESNVENANEQDEPTDQRQAEHEGAPGKKIDPYAVLRVTPNAGMDEIRAAYKMRIKAVHPDSIAALGLDEDLARAAVKTTQKLNYAYRKILREREETASQGPGTASA
jgi:hypothetical protein